jgi:serine/threonine-protein kinase
MPLTLGTHIGAFEIAQVIGAGGMGEVYRAIDTTLDREVAIKVLPESFATNADRVARFEREAKVLASLNHTNIAQIHGLERNSGTLALVMEFVEGPTLADRLLAGPLPPDEALNVAQQIVDALEAAHGRGIVHRDLKPANIKLKHDGTVKVLDFGIAKALQPQATSGEQALALTIPALTELGVVLGTTAYMSPEQARGRPVDQRADIWAFGCVLYEMLVGHSAFAGADATTLAEIFERDTDAAALPSAVPPAVRRSLTLCLRKDPRERIADIRDVRLALRGAFEPAAPPPVRFPWLAASALAVLSLLVGGATVWTFTQSDSPPSTAPRASPIRLQVNLSPGQRLSGGPVALESRDFALQRPSRPSFALSPDGRYLVYAATDGQTTQLYRRRLDQSEHAAIPGTEGAWQPFFSPDSRSVGFAVGSDLKRVSIDGGEVRTIAFAGDRANLRGFTDWTADDTILIEAATGVFEVPANGGEVTQLTRTDRAANEPFHPYPQMLPNRRGLLFSVASGVVPSGWTIVVQPLDGGERKVVIEGGSQPRYVSSGHIVFARNGALWAVPFDVERLEASGAAAIVVEDVMHAERSAHPELRNGAAQFSVSSDGALAYVPGGLYAEPANSLVWADRSGATEPLPLPPGSYAYPRVSPDGTRLAYTAGVSGYDNRLWTYDLALDVPLALTSAAIAPVWSSDGTRLAFFGGEGLLSISADGRGTPQPIGASEGTARARFPSSWSGDVLAFVTAPAGRSPIPGVWTLRMDGANQPEPFVQTDSASAGPAFSPDGKWLAYSAAAGADSPPDIYVRPFPEGAPVQRISTDGGWAPLWSPDGRQLFYRSPVAGEPFTTSRWMVVDVVTQPAFRPSRPRLLFQGSYADELYVRNFDITPDGERFLLVQLREMEPQPATSIDIVLNWFTELQERVPTPSSRVGRP